MEFKEGDLVVYRNGGSLELGVVKRKMRDGVWAVWYSGGDTAAATPEGSLTPLSNPAVECVARHAAGSGAMEGPGGVIAANPSLPVCSMNCGMRAPVRLTGAHVGLCWSYGDGVWDDAFDLAGTMRADGRDPDEVDAVCGAGAPCVWVEWEEAE